MRSRFAVALVLSLLSSHASAGEPRIVVLDAGHGGRLAGTHTTGGVSESGIVLGIAKHTRELLEKAGVRVIMTREDDRDIDLDARVALANGTKASAFISVHANYAPVPERRGAETYILSPNASDDVAAAVVDLENDTTTATPAPAPASAGSAAAPAGGGNDLDFILQDLQKMTAHQDSALLARAVQDSLGKVRGLTPSRGLRQAPFRVLRGANMPAVLVEVGYLSHPAQGALLATGSGQKQAAEAIAQGILRFLKGLDTRL